MDQNKSDLKMNSPLVWCTAIIPIGIIAIGINFILNPVGASAGFGIPINDPVSFPYLWIKGIRDIFSGVVVLTFLLSGNLRATSLVFAIATLIPISDGLVIVGRLGFAPPLLIHWGTALYMAAVSFFLLRKDQGARRAV